MVRLYGVLFLAQLVLAVCALISCLSAEEGQVRALPRIAWVLIILFFPLVGSIAWFAAGRERGARGGGGRPTGIGRPERRRPIAPDDDPDFLSALDERSRAEQRERLRREEELRRRETESGRAPDDRDRPEL